MRRAGRRRARAGRARRRRGAQTAAAELRGLFEYIAFMEEPLNRALDLTRALILAGQGLEAENARGDGRALRALGGYIDGQLRQVESMLLTLLKAAAEQP